MAIIETTQLLTAEQYGELPDLGHPTELVRGRVVMMNVPYSNHGRACGRIARLVGNYAEDQRLGQVFTNGSGIITEHNPDTVRGADIAYYSFHRVPAGQLPRGYLPIAPELVFEVLSPTDRRGDVLAKVAEYLRAGVLRVCLVDADRQMVTVFASDQPEVQLTGEQLLTLPEILPGWSVSIAQFFQ